MGTTVKLTSKVDLDEIQLAMLEARFAPVQWLRSILIAVAVLLLLLMLVGDHSVWRWSILVVLGLVGVMQSVRELVYPRVAERFRLVTSRYTWIGATVSTGALFLATGGLDSPLLPIIVTLCFFIGTLTPARSLVTLTVALSVVVCCLALVSWRGLIPDLMPVVFGGGASVPQPAALLWARAGALLFALLWAASGSSGIRHIFRQIVADALEARDEVLRSHDAHARELTALSGELAHELKNPLANMKGLAFLISRDVQGKGVERLEVLQREMARMEEVLQGFLTFSRPFTPLTLEEVELKGLCESVMTLHEGTAHARGLTLELSAAAAVRVCCDQRKVSRVLINLLQNALDASPAGAAVELTLGPATAGGARLEVKDRGPGISETVRAHLFELGSTTKDRGTGLGLALARGLAHQHGGELTLEDRDGGGCTAVLVLPARPPATEEEAA